MKKRLSLLLLLAAQAARADEAHRPAVSGRPVRAESRPKFPQQLVRADARARVAIGSTLKLQGGSGGAMEQWRVPLAFAGWYLLSIVYSVLNKQVLTMWKFPCVFSAVQLLVGSVWILLLWSPLPTLGLGRAAPELSGSDLRRLASVSTFLALGHVLSTVAPAYGTVSFTNVVKTLEPLFTCIFSAVLLNQVFSFSVYASLLPVIVGVIIASSSEVSFSWISLARAARPPPARPPADHPRLLAARRSRGCSRTCALRCARSARSR